MKQKIICKQKKCFDEKSLDTELEQVYDKTNLIDSIELELLKEML